MTDTAQLVEVLQASLACPAWRTEIRTARELQGRQYVEVALRRIDGRDMPDAETEIAADTPEADVARAVAGLVAGFVDPPAQFRAGDAIWPEAIAARVPEEG